MVKNIVTRSAFADLAGVSPAAVTKAAKKTLAPALVGKRIDSNHPTAVAYIQEQNRANEPEPVEGVDPLYEQALALCRATGRWSPTSIRGPLKIGSTRAKRIITMLSIAGKVPQDDEDAPHAIDEPPEISQPQVRTPRPISGHTAVRETKKSEALAKIAQHHEAARTKPQDPDDFEYPEDLRAFLGYTLRDLIRQFGSDAAFNDWLGATKKIEDIHEKRLKNAATEGALISRQVVRDTVIDPIETAMLRMMTDGARTITAKLQAMSKAGKEPHEMEDLVMDTIGSYVRPLKSKMARGMRNV